MPRQDYNERQEARIDRLEDRAEKAKKEASARIRTAQTMSEAIPFGQPILVGHHSEKRDRNFRNRIENNFRKGIEAEDKAKHLQGRAESARSNRTISSDDPEAVEKLRAKVEQAEAEQQAMKAANRIIRKKPKNEATPEKIAQLKEMFPNASEARLETYFQADFCGRVGFPDYALQNNNANIRRMKQRLAQLEQAAAEAENGEEKRTEYQGFTVIESPELNRIQIDFHSKEDYFRLCKNQGINLKSYGFRFSRNDGNVWQRLLNASGKAAAEHVTKLLQA